jgi:hypothetical protein
VADVSDPNVGRLCSPPSCSVTFILELASTVSLFLHTDWRDYVIQVYHERRTAALSLAHIHHLDGPGVGARRDRQNEADEGGLPNRGRPR